MKDFISASLDLSKNLPTVFLTLGVAVLLGVLAGAYPAFYLTSFQPSLVLKGNFGLSPKGKKIRNALVGFQYIVTFLLLITSSFMYMQNKFLHYVDYGYDRDSIIIACLNDKVRSQSRSFIQDLKKNPIVKAASCSQFILSTSDDYMRWGRECNGKQVSFDSFPVDPDFLTVMNIPIIEGRNFVDTDSQGEEGVMIMNKKAMDTYGFKVGDRMQGTGTIIGVMPDVKYKSLRKELYPMCFFLFGKYNWGPIANNVYIKVEKGTNLHEAMDYVRSTLDTYDKGYPFVTYFFDDVINNAYQKENNTMKIIAVFSLISILISIVGVFGLVVFESEYRRKEIGLRKVMGATTKEVLYMFNKTYVKVLTLCFVIAVPLAVYAVKQWLENFSYKTPLYWWVFLLSFVFVALFTIVIVTFQTWKNASANPIESIKTE
jgi:putative ABC transport system permease protein